MFDLKERLREANPIDEVISETISLRREGRGLVGAHHTHGSESGTSLHVDPDQGVYHCFNCHEGGDVFIWVMQLHQCSFPEALRHLAQRAHIPLPEWTAEERAHQQTLWEEREALKAVYLATVQFYRFQMTPEMEAWCMEQWGFSPTTLKHFGIGFANVDHVGLWRNGIKITIISCIRGI